MDERETLHTAARWFCIERLARLRRREDSPSAADPYSIAPAALVQLPHYAALEAMLIEIERIDPAAESTLGAVIGRIEDAANTAIDRLAARAGEAPTREAIRNAGRAFHDYLAEISIEPPALVARLPYRRTLDEDERIDLVVRLGQRWPVTFGNGVPAHVPPAGPPRGQVALRAQETRRVLGRDGFQRLLAARGIERVYELAAQGISREIGIDRFEPAAYTDPICWTTADAEWFIAVTGDGWLVAGGWMVGAITSEVAASS